MVTPKAPPCATRPLNRDHFSRIHYVFRIERAFDRAHQLKCRGRMLFQHVFHLGLADSMLAGAGAAHLETAPNEAFEKIFDAFDFIWIVDVNKRSAMKIAVADMTDDRRKDAALLRIAGRFGHTIGKPR